MRICSIGLLLLLSFPVFSQNTATLIGRVQDENKVPLPGVNIVVENSNPLIGVTSLDNGDYKIILPAGENLNLAFKYIGYAPYVIENLKLEPGERRRIIITLETGGASNIEEVEIRTSFEDRMGIKVTQADIEAIPTPAGNLESVLGYLFGVSSGTGGELSSQYNVRGGNYDENLVYVNDFRIYRPQLIRSGQQEGLTFPNPNFLQYLTFSSGGFEASYGDKMSSVLDVHYKRASNFGGSVEASLLGASAHVEGAIRPYKDSTLIRDGYRLSYLLGARYKTTQYILNTLDIQGEYIPQFVDLQGMISYDLSRTLQWELLGNYSNSVFELIPTERQSRTGLFNQTLQLSALFEGRELSNFQNYFVGSSLRYRKKKFFLKGLLSSYRSNENERIDIRSSYRLEEIETNLGAEEVGEVVGTLGYGETQLYARNFLTATVANAELRGGWNFKKEDAQQELISEHFIQFGAKFQKEIIDDQLNEWTYFDSLGYSMPYDSSTVSMEDRIRTANQLNSNRISAFIQDRWTYLAPKGEWNLALGLRAQYWDLNEEFIASPRAQLYYSPSRYRENDSSRTRNLTYKLAGGAYFQPPFYREMRNFEGEVNTALRAQKSWQILGGIVWDFQLFERPFKLIAEGYYKNQWDLVAYDIDNVRIRYYGLNNMAGYVTGLDLRLNGELVEDAESWVNLSLLRARERFVDVEHKRRELVGDSVTILNDVPKPTDQAMVLSMYFQDYLPNAKWCKVNLALTVGSGLPFGVPRQNIEFRNSYRFPAYHRIDLGFSFALWDRAAYIKRQYNGSKSDFRKSDSHFMRSFKSAWFSLEIFNLMQAPNVASNTWVRDFGSRVFAIPNFLTSRRINLRFRTTF